MKGSGSSVTRISVIHNNESKEPGLISRLVKAAIDTLDGPSALNILKKILKEDTAKKLIKGNEFLFIFSFILKLSINSHFRI